MLEALKYYLSREMPNWDWQLISSSGGQARVWGRFHEDSVVIKIFDINLSGTFLLVEYVNKKVIQNSKAFGLKNLTSYSYMGNHVDATVDCGVFEGSKTVASIKCDIANPSFSLTALITKMKNLAGDE